MKKLLFVITCVLFVSFSISAQGQGGQRGGTPEERAKAETERQKTELKLTAAQVPQIEKINLDIAKEQSQTMQGGGGGGDRTAMQEARQKLEAKRVAAYEKVLTKDQLETYKKLAAERQQQRGQGGGGGGNRPNN